MCMDHIVMTGQLAPFRIILKIQLATILRLQRQEQIVSDFQRRQYAIRKFFSAWLHFSCAVPWFAYVYHRMGNLLIIILTHI